MKLLRITGRGHLWAGIRWRMRGQDTKAIRDYLGHRNIQNTQLYTQLSPARFARFWRD
jgi:site-specific recombinase XerC